LKVTSDLNVYVFLFLNIASVSESVEMILFVTFGPLPLHIIYSFSTVYIQCISFLVGVFNISSLLQVCISTNSSWLENRTDEEILWFSKILIILHGSFFVHDILMVWYLKLTVGTPLYRMSSFTSFFAEASILKTLKLPTSNNSALDLLFLVSIIFSIFIRVLKYQFFRKKSLLNQLRDALVSNYLNLLSIRQATEILLV